VGITAPQRYWEFFFASWHWLCVPRYQQNRVRFSGWLARDLGTVLSHSTGQALVDFYHATNGPKWRDNPNWLYGDPCKQSWKGVFCWRSRITWLYVPNTQRKATYLAAHSLVFDDIENRHLHNNQVSGTIPSSIGSLVNLTSLYVNRI